MVHLYQKLKKHLYVIKKKSKVNDFRFPKYTKAEKQVHSKNVHNLHLKK